MLQASGLSGLQTAKMSVKCGNRPSPCLAHYNS
jgi:hypothetical protein